MVGRAHFENRLLIVLNKLAVSLSVGMMTVTGCVPSFTGSSGVCHGLGPGSAVLCGPRTILAAFSKNATKNHITPFANRERMESKLSILWSREDKVVVVL